MLRVSVSRALILFGRLAEILVLQNQVRKLIVDGCRIGLLRKGLEVGAVPLACLAIIGELLSCVACALILGVIMRREVFQVRLQVGQYFWRLFGFEMSPVFGLQAVLGSELPLRLQYQLGEPTLGESIHDAHAESWRGAVERIKRYETFVRLRRIVVAQLAEIVLAKTGVNAVLIGAIPELGEVFRHGLRPAEVAEAQADHPERIRNTAIVVLIMFLIEVVTDRYLVVEQADILLQRLLVEVLLVERPSKLVESELVELGGGSQFDDARIGALGVAVASAREEVLAPPELHFVEVRGMRIRADYALHCLDGLFGAAELVVRPRHLIEDLVAVLVIGVFGEQPIVERDRLEWTFGICARAHRVRRGSASVTARQDSGLRSRAPLEILIGFPQTYAGSCRGRIRTAGPRAREYRGGLRSGHFPRLGVARANTELLLELQVREAPHRLRSHCGLRCLLEEAPILLHRLIEALFDLHFLQVRTHIPQLRQRPRRPHRLYETRGAGDHENRRDHGRNSEATHQCPPASDWARAARS